MQYLPDTEGSTVSEEYDDLNNIVYYGYWTSRKEAVKIIDKYDNYGKIKNVIMSLEKFDYDYNESAQRYLEDQKLYKTYICHCSYFTH